MENKLITAKEAAERSVRIFNENSVNYEIPQYIYTRINTAISTGMREIDIDEGSMNPYIVKKLEELGYNVEHKTENNINFTKISW
jgi:hypothetical protein